MGERGDAKNYGYLLKKDGWPGTLASKSSFTASLSFNLYTVVGELESAYLKNHEKLTYAKFMKILFRHWYVGDVDYTIIDCLNCSNRAPLVSIFL